MPPRGYDGVKAEGTQEARLGHIPSRLSFERQTWTQTFTISKPEPPTLELMNAPTPLTRLPFPLHFPAAQALSEVADFTLELGEGLYGPRYYLGGQPVYDGSPLELCTPQGWVSGLFVWSGSPQARPKLVLVGTKRPPIMLETSARLRWDRR